MKKLEIYEPAGCASGVCDPMIEADLNRLERMIVDLRERGVSVSRYNVIDDMPAFMESFVVKQAIATKGIECLPLTIVDGKIELTSEYPTDFALARWVGLPWSDLEIYAEREKREKTVLFGFSDDVSNSDCDDSDCSGDCDSCG
ncbi:arsenic metallochaperone ArsD family protein [uncultured Acetobacterium sp.]|uniref:arsenic metallochaperone ArsD family protein n=1 Tax=uncultured Acetobacterium sp. TaxID=217139 RepID=UPI002420E0C6|nr:arsenic metallochaperone ArsD family protein [uncultured Acetobacterium sp.]MBU4542126.1 arsenic metallochaperone ArsD family protein [Bacillota bacterium]MDP2843080.1 arsenic metallochaperone ArsD family protein [Acetobacterium sp.]